MIQCVLVSQNLMGAAHCRDAAEFRAAHTTTVRINQPNQTHAVLGGAVPHDIATQFRYVFTLHTPPLGLDAENMPACVRKPRLATRSQNALPGDTLSTPMYGAYAVRCALCTTARVILRTPCLTTGARRAFYAPGHVYRSEWRLEHVAPERK